MSAHSLLKSAQLRHALRTPLNQIEGYSEMLLEDLSCSTGAVRDALHTIQENGRAILDVVQEELPVQDAEITPDHLEQMRRRVAEPIKKITSQLGLVLSGGDPAGLGLRVADVLRITSAVGELVDFTEGTRNFGNAAEPGLSADQTHLITAALTSGEVLVIDDNSGNRDLLSRMLDRQGLNVTTAAGGEEALTLIARRRFDLILLDFMMPDLDGITVLERIKSDPQRLDVPVIMLSALDETSRVIRCLEMGAEDYVVKPFDPVLLMARLRSTLERSRLRVAESMRARELEIAYEKLRENERRLQESEERLRLATEAAEIGIWYVYSSQDLVLMTPVCKRLFGFPEDDEPLRYEQVSAVVHPEDRERVDSEKRRALETQSEYDAEFRVIHPNGRVCWLSSRGLAQCHGSARETRLSGVALDITRRKQAEEAMLQAHKLESIGLLAGGIAHDFNNLLTGIIGSASFVADNLAEDDPNGDMLRNVINAGERAADLTRQLLAYSGKGKFKVQRLDLSRCVSEIAALLRTSISRGIVLDRHLSEGLPRIEGDATQIQQIIMNLVINASEAISGEGVVRVVTGTTHLGPDNREAIVLGDDVPDGSYVFLEVSDTGSGMDREILSKIFEPFFTTKFTGRGLGLAAVFGIVRGHEGALEVRTAPGAGSTFRVYFPPARTEVGHPQEGAQRFKVLFVDDESIVRVMGKMALERAGFAVLAAANGEEALKLFQQYQEEITLVVLDLTMPGWSGFDTLHRLNRIAPSIPVVLSSGYSEEEVRARYPGERIGSLLHKPYNASALVTRVKSVLSEKAIA